MATQYTAGLTAGQVLTAATMNSIGATWETWTPTITSSAGTLTSVTGIVGRYARINKIIIAYVEFTIANAGSGTGSARSTVPFPISSTYAAGPAGAIGDMREYAALGFTGAVTVVNSTTISFNRYDAASYVASNRAIGATFIYEAA